MQNKYPRFTPRAEELIIELSSALMKDPELLTRQDCPYEPKLRHALNQIMVVGAARNLDPSEVLKQNLPPKEADPQALTDSDLNADVDIEKEARQLYNQMKTTMATISNMDTGEKVQIFRVATQLLEKLLTLQEKATGIEHFKKFKEYIVKSMDRFLNPVQKTEFVTEIEEILAQD
tara:strand:- start:1253 stop:1780 length:528 start_codon:yes stop_codon:yes gene_type:complete